MNEYQDSRQMDIPFLLQGYGARLGSKLFFSR